MMLILTRKKNELIIINDDIEIIVLRTTQNQVKLGIEAPDDVLISRRKIDPPSEPME
jgi:carbon storage regulator